jgi:riboflavin synthase
MFTGITTDVGEVIAVEPKAEGLRRLKIACAYPRAGIAIGASIAHSGVCLTVVEIGEQGGRTFFAVDAAAETLRMTTAGAWAAGTRLNLERALKVGDELGGHIVTGHIDATAVLIERVAIGSAPATVRFELQAPSRLSKFIAEKGSVALDGTSLTVNAVAGDTFSVLLIPHSLAVTTWGERKPGDRINLEVDLMARYAARRAEAATADER